LVEQPQPGTYNALVIAVAHKQYTCLSETDFRALLQPGGVLFDLKGVLALGASDLRL